MIIDPNGHLPMLLSYALAWQHIQLSIVIWQKHIFQMIEVYVKRAPALRKAACDVTEVRERRPRPPPEPLLLGLRGGLGL